MKARKQVRFYTMLGQPSQFLVELVKAEHLKIDPVDGEALEACPKCGNGVLQLRVAGTAPSMGVVASLRATSSS